MQNLCKLACQEFEEFGYSIDSDPSTKKTSYNIIKQPNGIWYKSTKESLHTPALLKELNLIEMKNLKILIDELETLDDELKESGGRIFISEYVAYKIKKGKQTNLLFYENVEIINGKFRSLCDEIKNLGISRDRYRTEETYLLNKSSKNEWSIVESDENLRGKITILDLKQMPVLRTVCLKLVKLDSKLSMNGGRIFITPTKIYRLNNKVEQIFKI